MSAALAAFRRTDPRDRAVMGDFDGLLRRARWMHDLEDKIGAAKAEDSSDTE